MASRLTIELTRISSGNPVEILIWSQGKTLGGRILFLDILTTNEIFNWILKLLIDEVKTRIEGYKNALHDKDDDDEGKEKQTPLLRTENRKTRKKKERSNVYYNNFGEQFEEGEDPNDLEDFGLSEPDEDGDGISSWMMEDQQIESRFSQTF